MVVDIAWKSFYYHEWEFWVTMLSLLFVWCLVSYFMLKSLSYMWCGKSCFSLCCNCTNSDSNSNQNTSKIHGAIKTFVTIYLLLVWLQLILLSSFRVYMVILKGTSLYCWVKDVPFSVYYLARLSLGWMYLARFVFIW